jgi:hypothetical protein
LRAGASLTVPAEFAATISLEAHQKKRLITPSPKSASGSLRVCGCGRAAAAHHWRRRHVCGCAGDAFSDVIGSAGYMRGLALVVGVMILSSLISIPFDLIPFNVGLPG